MHELKVTGFVGTPDFLMTLIKRAEEKGYDFRRDFALRHAFLSAGILTASLRRRFEQDYGIEVTEGYGIAEVPNFAYECSEKSGIHISERVFVEIVAPATGKHLHPGEMGEVVITSFEKTYPLIHYGTGDLSCCTNELCSCGRTSAKLVKIMGRVGEEIKTKGIFLVPKQVEEVASRFDEISKYQLLVGSREYKDELTFRIELKDEAIDKERISNEISRSFREICRLGIDKIEFAAKGTLPQEYKTMVDLRKWG